MKPNVDIYLRSAFKELDAFSIPGIGTFTKIHLSAQADPQSGQLHPPSTEIEFSPTVNADLHLDRYFTENLQMEAAEANRIVAQISTTLLKSLAETGRFEIPKIGILRKTQAGQLSFYLYKKGQHQLDADYFGLPVVPFSSQTETHADSRVIHAHMKNGTPASQTQPRSAVGWKSFLLVTLLIALGFLIINNGPFVKQRSSLVQGLKVRFNEPETFAEKYAPSLEKAAQVENETSPVADNATETTTEVTSPSTSSRPSEPTPSPVASLDDLQDGSAPQSGSAPQDLIAEGATARRADPQTRTRGLGNTRGQDDAAGTTQRKAGVTYHLIVGSFKYAAGASEYVAQLKGEGYNNPVILSPESGSSMTHKVSVFESHSREEVEAYANKLKQLGKKTGWVYVQRIH
ncbi:MAG: SPOR domain-containing protein [Bacteroidota bacterium]